MSNLPGGKALFYVADHVYYINIKPGLVDARNAVRLQDINALAEESSHALRLASVAYWSVAVRLGIVDG